MADKKECRSVNTPEEVAEIAKAWAEGKQIERQCPGTATWSARINPDAVPEFKRVKYRIKPEPKEVFVVLRSNGAVACTHLTQAEAEEAVRTNNIALSLYAPYGWMRFREVVE